MAANTLAHATVTEDIFITLRVIEHLLDGHGLRWNLDERVQVFTHPLWLALITPFVAAAGNPRNALTLVGLLCTTGAFAVSAWPYRQQPWFMASWLLAPFVGSAALTYYGTSGLENPLSHLMVALFCALWLRGAVMGGAGSPETGVTRWGGLSLVTALAMTNRLDACLLFAPALLWRVAQVRGRLPWARVLLAASPLLAWLIFATLYYGYPLPNTAYAKLPPSIARSDYYMQGLRYLQELFIHDLVSGVWLVAMLIATGAYLRRARSESGESRHVSMRIAVLGLGGLLHMLYVIHVGGDYLSGRFWSPTLMLAVQVVATSAWPMAARWSPPRVRWVHLGAIAAMALLCVPRALRPEDPRIFFHHIQAHAGIHFVLDWQSGWPPPWRPAAGAEFATDLAQGIREQVESGGNRVMTVRACGLVPYLVGPKFLPMDSLGLGDPLIARLRPECPTRFRPGHNPRVIPPGFEHARRTGDLSRLPEPLRYYYAQLRKLTRAPVLSRTQLRAFYKLHLGRFDHLIEGYNENLPTNCSEPILE